MIDAFEWNGVTIAVVVMFCTLMVVLLLVIWSIKRHRDPDLEIECDSGIEDLMPSLAGLALGTAVDGNSVELFENGAYFDVLIEAIGSAQHSVHFETFLWKRGA